MSRYILEDNVAATKKAVTNALLDMKENKASPHDVAVRVDALNKATDALTSALLRQIQVRDRTVQHLQNLLAEKED